MEQEIRGLIEQGKNHFLNNRLRPALWEYLRAWRLARRHSKDPELRTGILYSLGTLCMRLGDEVRARRYLHLGLEQKGAPLRNYGILRLNMGLMYYMQGNSQQAAEQWLQAEAIFQEAGEALFLARCRNNLGVIALEQGDLNRAKALLHEAKEELERLGDRESYRTGTELTRLYLQENDIERARMFAEQTMEQVSKSGDIVELGRILCVMAEIYDREGKQDAAQRSLNEALQIFAQHSPWELHRCHQHARKMGYNLQTS